MLLLVAVLLQLQQYRMITLQLVLRLLLKMIVQRVMLQLAVFQYLPIRTGQFNIGVGRETLNHNQDGASNIAIGYQAVHTNVSGSYNAGIGRIHYLIPHLQTMLVLEIKLYIIMWMELLMLQLDIKHCRRM